MPSRLESLRKSIAEKLKNVSGRSRSNLAPGFFRKVERGRAGFSSSEFESARRNLESVLERVSAIPDFSRMSGHAEVLIDSAIRSCRTTKELQKLCGSILNLDNPPRAAKRFPPRATGRENLRVLIVSGMAPSIKHGGGLRIFDIINELPQTYEIDLYCRYRKELDRESVDMLRPRLSSVELVYKLKLDKILAWLDRENKLDGYYDVIQFEYPPSIKLIPTLSEHTSKTVFTFMEVVARSHAIDIVNSAEGPGGAQPPERSRRFILSLCAEAAALSYADSTIAVTEADARFCEALGNVTPEIVPHGVSSLILDDVRNTEISTDFSALPRAAVFVGYYAHLPNIEAVEWYLRDIHPSVLRRVPQFKVYIVGGGDLGELKREFEGDDSIVFTGWVECLGPWIAKGSICISPLVSGAGLRGKINQYSSYGRPTVSTSIGTQGIEYEDRKSVLIADGPVGFADAMVELMENEEVWTRVCRGSQVVASNWQWSRLIGKIREIYES